MDETDFFIRQAALGECEGVSYFFDSMENLLQFDKNTQREITLNTVKKIQLVLSYVQHFSKKHNLVGMTVG